MKVLQSGIILVIFMLGIMLGNYSAPAVAQSPSFEQAIVGTFRIVSEFGEDGPVVHECEIYDIEAE